MDASRFDALARALGAARSRRGLGQLLGGFILGGTIAARAATGAEAKKKHKKHKKPKRKGGCPKHCGGGTLCCDDTCVSVLTDRNNCGACGNSCTEKETCVNAQCVPCQDPQTICKAGGEERCVDLQTDKNNCGFCGHICPKDPENAKRDFVCQGGDCVCTGTVCDNGRCCPADFNVCVGAGGSCCATGFPVHCDNGICCPAGFSCGGSCGQNCCA